MSIKTSRVLSGIQPTNDLTLGNYLGSIKQFVELQQNYEMYIFVADLHAITASNINPKELHTNSINLVKSYLSFGLDPNKTVLFVQSSISAHTELGYFLMCQTTLGELNRMTQFKDKSQKYGKEANGTQKIPTGILIYPALMAADILLYSPDLVPVGKDQKQHLELTRNLAERINNKFNKDLFKLPNYFSSTTTAKINDLQDCKIKMSKSSTNHKGVIFLNDPIDVSIKKIMSAKTDSLNKIAYNLETQPEIYNLINIFCGLTNKTPDEVCEEFKNKNYGEFKTSLANNLKIFLENYQAKFNSYNDDDILNILNLGNKKANMIATKKLNEIYESIGILNCEQK